MCPAESSEDDDRESSFRLEISLAVGYQRRRTVLGGVWEGRIVTFALLLAGIAVSVAVVVRLLQLL